ncbi:unnamed protein product [Triticum turgidum subsp. durum]|uniref:Uncharacterized protein n=1 Tax=Triticum turgidum subsp. durum TaxID=4567 RepID=A0A9R0RZV9_TRITD|nr:unnamed protein product [Triticum turgidum subsp. durum]
MRAARREEECGWARCAAMGAACWPPAQIWHAAAGGLRSAAQRAGMDATDPALAAQDGQFLCPVLLLWSPWGQKEMVAGRRSVAGGPGGALAAAGGARLSPVGAGWLRPRMDAGCRTRYGLCRPVDEEVCGWPDTAVACSLCRGCAVQWRYGPTSACCAGVAAPGESLAGADRPAATAPMGVAILLGGVVGNLHSLHSRIKSFG